LEPQGRSRSFISSLSLGVNRELAKAEHQYSLKRNFLFHWLFLDLLLRGSDLERESMFKEGGSRELRGKKSLMH
jgi:hypothetical protein